MFNVSFLGLVTFLWLEPTTVAAADDWQTVTSRSPEFSVSMPVEPKTLRQTMQSAQGPVEQTVYYAKANGVFFSAQVLRMPKATPRGKAEQVLDRECQGAVTSSGGTLVRQKKVTLGNYPAWDAVLRQPAPGGANGTVTARLHYLLVDEHLISLTVMSRIDAPLPEDADRFIASFTLAKAKGGPAAKEATKAGGETPEDALRAFLLAVATHDEPALRAVTLPAEGIEWLLKGEAVPPDQLEGFVARFKREPIPIRRLKAGDKFTLPGGREITVPPDDVTPDRAVLVPADAPTPTRMRKVDGHWRVDAAPLIAARKAGDAARRKAPTKKR